MKALSFSKERGLQLDHSRSVKAVADDEATVEVIYAGICSTVPFSSHLGQRCIVTGNGLKAYERLRFHSLGKLKRRTRRTKEGRKEGL